MILPPELKHVAKTVRVLQDRVLVRPLPYVHPVLKTPGVEIQKGLVVAVGYGRRHRRKTGFRHAASDGAPVMSPDGKTVMRFTPSRMTGKTIYFEDGAETGLIIPMQVKPGDVVEFGFRNIVTVDFDQIGFPGVGKLAFIRQKAIYCIDDAESQSNALLWQQSAGHDRHGNFMSGAEDWHRA